MPKTNAFSRAISAIKDDKGEAITRILGPATTGTFTIYAFFGLLFKQSGFAYFEDGMTHAIVGCLQGLIPHQPLTQLVYVLVVGTMATLLVASALELAFDVLKGR